jgi:predicted RNase H-like HicB family nuclease
VKDNYPIVIFWSDEDEAYIADLPDLHSCSAWGDTPEEALRELLIAREAWLEVAHAKGFPLPDPELSPYLPETARKGPVEAAATS